MNITNPDANTEASTPRKRSRRARPDQRIGLPELEIVLVEHRRRLSVVELGTTVTVSLRGGGTIEGVLLRTQRRWAVIELEDGDELVVLACATSNVTFTRADR